MGDFHSSLDESNLVDGLDVWGESTMDAENLAFNNSTNSKVIENLSAIFPWVGISVLSDGLIIESVDGGDLSSLVVASQKSNVGGVLKFETKEQLESFYGVVTSVNEVTHENIASVWDLSSFIE